MLLFPKHYMTIHALEIKQEIFLLSSWPLPVQITQLTIQIDDEGIALCLQRTKVFLY